jgi:hypothetical protein
MDSTCFIAPGQNTPFAQDFSDRLLALIASPLYGQADAAHTAIPAAAAVSAAPRRAAEPNARYYRLICLVHVTGSGKVGDPVRPEYVPTVADATRQGIVAWAVQLTDDKSMAIIHVAAINRKAFAPIFADTRPEIRVFEIGKSARATIEAEMQKYKAGFDLSTFEVWAQ